MAERIVPPSIEGKPRLAVSLEARRHVEQPSIVVHVTMADDQCIGLCGIDFQPLVVVCKCAWRERKVQQYLFLLRPSERLQMKGQSML